MLTAATADGICRRCFTGPVAAEAGAQFDVVPNLSAAVGLVRGGAGTARRRSGTVAERLREYPALGIDTVIRSGFPHLEEAYRVGELSFPALGRGGGLLSGLRVTSQ